MSRRSRKKEQKKCKEILVSWEGFDEKDGTWNSSKICQQRWWKPSATARRNRRSKQKQTRNSLNNLLLREIDKRWKFSTKSKMERGTFAKKDAEDLPWKNYVRCFSINTLPCPGLNHPKYKFSAY